MLYKYPSLQRAFLVALFFCLTGTAMQSQIVIDSYTSPSTFIQQRPGRAIGATFNAGPTNVTATSVRLQVLNTPPGAGSSIVHLYAGGNPAGQQCIASSAPTPVTSAGAADFTFQNPVNLTANQTYTWVVFPANGVFIDYRSGTTATGKQGYVAFGGSPAQCPAGNIPPLTDVLAFQVFGTATPVPTLSQWGLILFALTMLCIGGVVLHNQRHRIFSQQTS